MKALALGLCFLILSTTQALSYVGHFRAHPHISVSQFQATATLVNQSFRPVVCSGYVYGRTWSGMTPWGQMNGVVIYPGQYAHVHATTNTYDPFVNAWSDLWCRYL
jgi:hypothetical protein